MRTIVFVSPRITMEEWRSGLKSDVDVFADQLEGWIFEQIEALVRRPPEDAQHAGAVLLTLVSAYFEMITCYLEGRAPRDGESSSFLRRGLETVLGADTSQEAIGAYVKEVRNGLAHELVFCTVALHFGQPRRTQFGLQAGVLTVDPFWLATMVRRHFHKYVARLRNPTDDEGGRVLAAFESFMAVRKRRGAKSA